MLYVYRRPPSPWPLTTWQIVERAVGALKFRREDDAVRFDTDMKGELPVIIRNTLKRHTDETEEAKRNGSYSARRVYYMCVFFGCVSLLWFSHPTSLSS